MAGEIDQTKNEGTSTPNEGTLPAEDPRSAGTSREAQTVVAKKTKRRAKASKPANTGLGLGASSWGH